MPKFEGSLFSGTTESGCSDQSPQGTATEREKSLLFYEYGSGNQALSKYSQLHLRKSYTLHFINPIISPQMYAELSSPEKEGSSDQRVCQGGAE